jgi:hypothetical protein
MNDPGLVRRRERRSDLDGDVERGDHRHLPVGQNLTQRQPFDEFGGDEMRRAVIADLVNGDDVRVVKRAGRARLLLEPEQPLVVLRSFVEQQFERDLSFEPHVAGQKDFSHPAGA